VDIILRKDSDFILLERRGHEPFTGRLVIPGGHVDYGETVEEAVLRELMEECSVKGELEGILGVYSDPRRDPRGQRISTVFIGNWISGEPKAGDDAASVQWSTLQDVENLIKSGELAFDHSKILGDYLKFFKNHNKPRNQTFWSTKK